VASGDDADAASVKATVGVAGVGLTNLGDARLAHLDADVSSRMATYAQPTGFLAATFPATVGDATAASQTTILARLGAFTGSGVNTILGFFKALLSKSATLPSDVGGTFDPATDSTEAIRDRGDAAWTTATSVTVSDKTGFKLASDGLALVTAWTVDVTGSLSGSVGSVTGAVGSVTGNVGGSVASVTGAVGSVTGNVGGNVTGSVGSLAAQAKTDVAGAALATQMTESYAADGTAPTLTQATFLIMQMLTEFTISGTTMTVKKLDGSTPAATMTLDDATNPTGITRAT
jgi:hypothetical protein